MFLVSAHLSACTYGFIYQAADTYVDQLQSCRPEILYPQLVHDNPQNRNPENILLPGLSSALWRQYPTVTAAAVCYRQLIHHWVNCLCVADASVLEFSAQTSNYKGVFRTNSVDMIDNLEAESDHSTDSCHSRMRLSSFSCLFVFKKLTLVQFYDVFGKCGPICISCHT